MYNDTYINSSKRNPKEKVNFLFATVDAMQPWNIGPCLNFAECHDFELKQVLYGIRLEETNGIVRPGAAQGPTAAPTYFVFVCGTFENFKKFYGEEYSEENIPSIPNKTAEKLHLFYKENKDES